MKQINVTNSAGQSQSTIGAQEHVNFIWADPAKLAGFINVNDRMILQSVRAECSFVNSSSTNSTIIIYDIIARKDTSNASVGSPAGAWSYGVDSAGGSATDYKVIGSIPSESVAFNQFYKIVQRTRISLGPGQMHRHEVTFFPNKVLTGQHITNVAYQLAGITLSSIVTHYGMPAHDSTTTTDVTVDVSALDYVQKVSYDWRLLEDATTAWSKSNNLATTFAVGEQFVNEAVGQVQDAGGLHPGTLHT